MAKTVYILFLFIILSVPSLHGQELHDACAGSTHSYSVLGFDGSIFHWEVNGEPIEDQYNDTLAYTWNNVGTYTISVTEITEFGCHGIPRDTTVVVKAPIVELDDEYELCAGEIIIVEPYLDYETDLTYDWQNGSSSAILPVNSVGKIWITATGTDGCFASDTSMIIVNPLPVVDLGNDTILCGSNKAELDAGMHAFYNWSTGQINNPIMVGSPPSFTDTIVVVVTDYNGCNMSDTVVIYQCNIEKIFGDIPNTITPNGDTDNDVWEIQHIDYFPGAIVEIFDRGGKLIYHVKNPDPHNVWDGKTQTGKEVPMGSYYYVIDIKFKGVDHFTGTINVIR